MSCPSSWAGPSGVREGGKQNRPRQAWAREASESEQTMMRTKNRSVLILWVAAGILSGCLGAQSRPGPVDEGVVVSLALSDPEVGPFGACELVVSITAGSKELRAPTSLFATSSENDVIDIEQPDGSHVVTSCVQPPVHVDSGSGFSLLSDWDTKKFVVLAGYDFVGRTPLFERPGVYKIVVRVGGSISNQVQLRCTEVQLPADIEAIVDALRESRRLHVLYNPNSSLSKASANAFSRVEELSQRPRQYAIVDMARITTARAALLRGQVSSSPIADRGAATQSALALIEELWGLSWAPQSLHGLRRQATDQLRAIEEKSRSRQ